MRRLLYLCSLLVVSIASSSSAQEKMAIRALRAAPRLASLYEISFVTSEALAVDAEIRISFSASYDLSALEIAGSTSVNGGLTLTRDGQRVIVKRSGLGTVVPRGQGVSLQLGVIKNPATLATAEPVRVEVLHSKKSTTAKAFTTSVEFQSR